MKSSEVIISVFVPVYNAEKYLKRCVDSILSQSFSDFELLLIDDGSSDLSGLFCDEYAIADKRVSAFHTDNNGVSGARQYGLNIAKGKYIQFIDSDDWIEQDCFEKLFLIAEDKNADIVISDFYVNSKNNVKIVRQRYTGNLIEDLFTGRVFGGLCHKLVKKAAIDNASIAFNHQLNFCEDLCFLCELVMKISNVKIIYIGESFYHYCINSISLTHSKSLKKVLNEEHYINVIQNIIPKQPASWLQCNKISVKWGYLRYGKLSYRKYLELYPELVLRQKKLKYLIINICKNRICYYIINTIFRIIHW